MCMYACVCLSVCLCTEIKAVMVAAKQSFDRSSDRDIERQTSKQTAKPTGRHKDRALGGAKWQLGKEMTDFSAVWHSCFDCQGKMPPLETLVTWWNLTRGGQILWRNVWVSCSFYSQNATMIMLTIIPCYLSEPGYVLCMSKCVRLSYFSSLRP